MDKVFCELQEKYQAALKTKNMKQQEDLINEMQQRLIQRNDCKEEYTTTNGETICLIRASYPQLLRINGEMNRFEVQNRLDEISNEARDRLMRHNNYTPDNPYPTE